MADDELLLACEAAPRFGLNAKAIILKAAAESDEEALPSVQSPADGEEDVLGLDLGAARVGAAGAMYSQHASLSS